MPQQPLVLMMLEHAVPLHGTALQREQHSPSSASSKLLWKEIHQPVETQHAAQGSCSSQWSWESRKMLLKKSVLL